MNIYFSNVLMVFWIKHLKLERTQKQVQKQFKDSDLYVPFNIQFHTFKDICTTEIVISSYFTSCSYQK